MNELLLQKILHEKGSAGSCCRLKSTFEDLDKAKRFMDDANAVSGLAGFLMPDAKDDHIQYNVELILYYKFDKEKFKLFFNEFKDLEIDLANPVDSSMK